MLEDRASVKRSVLGSGCHVGSSCKVGARRAWGRAGLGIALHCVQAAAWGMQPCPSHALTAGFPTLNLTPMHRPLQVVNCVIMDDVRLGPGCNMHNCILGSNCVVGEGARLRDCQLAPGYSVPAGAELTEEVLPAPPLRE